MAALNRILRSVAAPGRTGVAFWCPGCDSCHVVYTKVVDSTVQALAGTNPIWQWNEDAEEPTISPSILVYETAVSPRCHSFVKLGKIEFLPDCTHALRGQTVPLPDFPEGFSI